MPTGREWLRSDFNPRSPVRRATPRSIGTPKVKRFQSTLSVRRATSHVLGFFLFIHISIHALRKESDSLDAYGVAQA